MSKIKPINYVRCQHCDTLVCHGIWCGAKEARALGLICPNYECRNNKSRFYDSLEIHRSLAELHKPWTWFKKEIIKCNNNT